jgi:hypothetical protein
MPGSAVRFAVAIVFDLIVAVIFRFFGASLPTCWFTFLLLLVFAAVAEVDLHLNEIERKLDAIGGIQDKSEARTETMFHALARIEGKLEAIPS